MPLGHVRDKGRARANAPAPPRRRLPTPRTDARHRHPHPDAGAVESDLRALARALAQSMTGPVGRAVQTAMHSDAGRLPEIAEARRRLFADRFRRAEPVITRAIERGELPAETDPVELLKTLAAPIYFRLLVSAEPIEEGTADQAVRITLAAALTQGSAVAVKATEADAGQA
ncbi:TetR/AcrR family transcriptional regulator C-terminal ligand-binding domain-containing protein [Streptomyces sp. PKU-EA00015]|uniref:TetR-like C-terminal domain-containing protein n=1 Tax=Streptomyces sp. PKU-EA00015 TaxID=2748326 RepID=UPI0015A182FF|nr:TetR-like C-terminal domain-containing protein [Streptomyces sp. PKU-EA00015]NWF28679.1 TetR/AcrR family transcriptional regulator C-terminal ligand-binding domain-containing protein [Streptomyces sp. PKU-EA00015]